MKEITLNVSKVLVYNEVKKSASYQASKLIDKDPQHTTDCSLLIVAVSSWSGIGEKR